MSENVKVYKTYNYTSKFIIPFSIYCISNEKSTEEFVSFDSRKFADDIMSLRYGKDMPIWVENDIDIESSKSFDYTRYMLLPVQEMLYRNKEDGFIYLKANKNIINRFINNANLNVTNYQKKKPVTEVMFSPAEYNLDIDLIICYTGICFFIYSIETNKELPVDTLLNLNYFFPKSDESDYIDIYFSQEKYSISNGNYIRERLNDIFEKHQLPTKHIGKAYGKLITLHGKDDKEKREVISLIIHEMSKNLNKKDINSIIDDFINVEKQIIYKCPITSLSGSSENYVKNIMGEVDERLLEKELLGDYEKYIHPQSIYRLYDRPIIYSYASINTNDDEKTDSRIELIGEGFDPKHRFLRGFSATMEHKAVESYEEGGLEIIKLDENNRISIQMDFVCFWLDGWNEYIKSTLPSRLNSLYFMTFILVLSQFFTLVYLSHFHQLARKSNKTETIRRFLELLRKYRTEMFFEVVTLNVNLKRFYEKLRTTYHIKELLSDLDNNLSMDEATINSRQEEKRQKQDSLLTEVLAFLTFLFTPLAIIADLFITLTSSLENNLDLLLSIIISIFSMSVALILFIRYNVKRNRIKTPEISKQNKKLNEKADN